MQNLGKPIRRGKVCDIYAGEYVVLDRTNRVSAFDSNLPIEIPHRGLILNQMSIRWMKLTEHIIQNHLIATDAHTLLVLGAKPDQMGRVVAAKPCYKLPFEFIVRGHYIPSSHSWDSYKEDGTICGIELPEGLEESEKLYEPIFTPSTKEEDEGKHDRNIDYDELVILMKDYIYGLFSDIFDEEEVDCEECDCKGGCDFMCCEANGKKDPDEEMSFDEYCDEFAEKLCEQIREVSINLYEFGYTYCMNCDIIMADTKFEFGLDENLNLTLIDELFTPDSSRFWNANTFEVGKPQKSMDKQYLRDYVSSLSWHGIEDGPAPEIPDYVAGNVCEIYALIYQKLFYQSLDSLTEELSFEWYAAEKELGLK